MATILYYNQPGYIERQGVGKDALDKQIDKMRLRSNKTVLQGAKFYRVETPRGGVFKEAAYGNGVELPRKSEDSAPLPAVTSVPGYTATATIETYRSSIKVERAMVEDQLSPVVRKMMSGMIRSGRLTLEYAMADKWNNITSTSTGYVGPDGVALASASHPQERRETGTWSNIETGATLTHAAFTTARTNMRKRTDEFGYVMSVFPRALVVPPDLEGKAKEIKQSEKVPENALNAKNVWRSDPWEVFVYDYLTDTNAWTLWGDVPADAKPFIMAQKVAPSLAPLTGSDKSTDIIWGQRLRMRFATTAQSDGMRWVQYNAGPS